MPRKKIKPLFQQSVSKVSETIWAAVLNHCDSPCQYGEETHPELCPFFKSARDTMLTKLPQYFIRCIYNEIYSMYIIKLQNQGKFWLQLYCYLLQHSGLEIERYNFSESEDIGFLMQFGKSVRYLNFDENTTPMFGDDYDHFWKDVLFWTTNLKILDLDGCRVTDDLLEVIGSQCSQIEEILNVMLHANITVQSIKKLLYQDYQNSELKTKCCETIQIFELQCFGYYGIDKTRVGNAILLLLLRNLPNLRTFGEKFYLENFLKSLDLHDIPVTKIEHVYLNNVSEDILPLLKIFCPNMNYLSADYCCSHGWTTLHNVFPRLEFLCISNYQIGNQFYDRFASTKCSMLKKLKMDFSTFDVQLQVLARQLPVLETLYVIYCERIEWNGRTYFQCLKNITFFTQEFQDLSCFSSFAKTIEIVRVDTLLCVDKDVCHILLRVPFPQLKYFNFHCIHYDFDFITRVLATCPSLKGFGNVHGDNGDKNEVFKFLNENNFECGVKFIERNSQRNFHQ